MERKLSVEEVANKLIEMYKSHRKRFMISSEDFKKLANRKQLRDRFLEDVDKELREQEYCLIDLREFNDSIAVIKVSVILNNWDFIRE